MGFVVGLFSRSDFQHFLLSFLRVNSPQMHFFSCSQRPVLSPCCLKASCHTIIPKKCHIMMVQTWEYVQTTKKCHIMVQTTANTKLGVWITCRDQLNTSYVDGNHLVRTNWGKNSARELLDIKMRLSTQCHSWKIGCITYRLVLITAFWSGIQVHIERSEGGFQVGWDAEIPAITGVGNICQYLFKVSIVPSGAGFLFIDPIIEHIRISLSSSDIN